MNQLAEPLVSEHALGLIPFVSERVLGLIPTSPLCDPFIQRSQLQEERADQARNRPREGKRKARTTARTRVCVFC